MKHSIDLQPAFLLHARPFRDTSLLLDFLTRDFGRINVIAKGVRRSKNSNKGLLQPFVPLYISLSGKSDLKILRNVELRSDAFILKANALFSALYLNELLVRLVQGQEEAGLFSDYEKVLADLSITHELEPLLRSFELALLDTLGYGINFIQEGITGESIVADQWYYFHHEDGFNILYDIQNLNKSACFFGADLINIAARDYALKQTRTVAKRILRQAFLVHLGDKPLKSRQLFAKLS